MFGTKGFRNREIIIFIRILPVFLFLVLTASASYAGWSDCAVDWSLFSKSPGYISTYTYKGQAIADEEAKAGKDTSHGQANVPPDQTDLASMATSGNNPGPGPTAYFGYYDGGTRYDRNNPSTMLDDIIFFRVRVAGDPRHGSEFDSYHWNILFDVDADGYKEYWIDLEGSYSQNNYDRLNILYDNSNNQTLNPNSPGVRVNYFTAYNAQDAGTRQCPYGVSHTRTYPVGDGSGDWFIEEQMPMTAFKDSNGNQVLFPTSPVAFVFSTGASNQDPLQKDWMMDLKWLGNADPIVFGDIIIPDGEPVARFTDSSMNFTSFYTVGDRIYVYVKDPLANTDGNVVEQLFVTVSDPKTGDDEVLTLIETGPNTGIFSNAGGGSALTTSQADGIFNNSDNNHDLETSSGDTVYVTYTNKEALTVVDQAAVVAPCEAFIQFTRANGFPSDRFVLTNDPNTSDRLYVTITNYSANTDPNTQQNTQVSLTGNDAYTLPLTETGNDTGVFRNTTGLQTGIQVNTPTIKTDNIWEDNDGGTVTATCSYTCGGAPYTVSATARLFVTAGAGTVSFTNGAGTQDAGVYTPGQPVFVKVQDNTYSCGGTMNVTITGSSGDSETLPLTQTATGSGVYMNRTNDLVTTAGSAVVTSASSNFNSPGVHVGDLFVIATGADMGTYTIANVNSSTTLTLTKSLTSSATGVGFTATPLVTAALSSGNAPNNGILTAANGDILTVTYHDCNDGDGLASNDDKTDTAVFNTPPVLINEVLFWPDPATCQTEYVQLYNSSSQPVDVTGYRITDDDQFTYTIPQFNGSDILLGVGQKIYISVYDIVPGDKYDSATGAYYLFAPEAAKTGTFPSEEFGDPGETNVSDQADQISLYNSSGTVVDYVAWSSSNTPSTDFISDFSPPVAAGIWQDGAYVSTSGMNTGEAIRRISDGFDTNAPGDWTFTGTSTVCQTIITRAVVSSFSAHAEDGKMVVQWKTASENGTAGFNLMRLDRTSGIYRKINGRLLPAVITSPRGGSYRLIDRGASLTDPETYMLVEIEGNGRQNTYGPYTGSDAAEGAAPLAARFSSPKAGLYTIRTGDGLTVVTDDGHGLKAAGASALQGGNDDEVSGYTRTPLPRLPLPSGPAKAAVAAVRPAAAVAGTASLKAKLAVEADGLYYLSSSKIAGLLGISDANATALIQTNGLSVEHGGSKVAYLPQGPGYSGIYFYGSAIDSPYTRDNIYWLKQKKGLRMFHNDESTTSTAPGNAGFAERVHFEQDLFTATAFFTDPSSDYWFWDYIVSGDPSMGEKSFTLHTDGVAPSSDTATLTISLQGATDAGIANEHHAVFSLNGAVIGQSSWQGLNGNEVTLSFSQGLLKEGDNTLLVEGALDDNVPYSIFYVNSFDLAYRRVFKAVSDRLTFRPQAASVVTVGGFSDRRIMLFDISNPLQPKRIFGSVSGESGNYTISFMPRSAGRLYLAAARSAAFPVTRAWTNTPSSLKKRNNRADYLIITTAELKDAARALAAYRQATGLDSRVVLQEDIMDEFNHGIYSPEAIRAFLSYAYHYWRKVPRYVLLAGNGTYDYRDVEGYGDNLVPSVMVGTPDGLFSSDNHFADVAGDHVPRMAVGRLPARTAAELQDAVSKIIAYETAGSGNWEQNVLFAADYPESDGDFSAESDELAALVPTAYSLRKVYLSDNTMSGARALLLNAIGSGVSFLNYKGHAALDRFSGNGLLLSSDVSSMQNSPRLPVVAAMTCVVGQFDIPGYRTLAETLVMKPDGGAVAIWSPTGLSKDSLAQVLDTGFIGSALAEGEPVLGNALLDAFQNYADAGNEVQMIDIFGLIGDPGLHMRMHQ